MQVRTLPADIYKSIYVPHPVVMLGGVSIKHGWAARLG